MPKEFEDRAVWSSALSISLSLMSLVQLSYDRWWGFVGSYPATNITVMIALNISVLTVNLVIFFYFVPSRIALEKDLPPITLKLPKPTGFGKKTMAQQQQQHKVG